MTAPMLAMSAVAVILGIGLAYLGYRLWTLDRDMASLTHDYHLLQKELKTAHERHVRSIDGQLNDLGRADRHLTHRLGWVESWVTHWVKLSQQREAGR